MVTEVVILLRWAPTTWNVYFTLKDSGHAIARNIALTLVGLAWSIFAFGAVNHRFDRKIFVDVDVRPLVYLLLLKYLCTLGERAVNTVP